MSCARLAYLIVERLEHGGYDADLHPEKVVTLTEYDRNYIFSRLWYYHVHPPKLENDVVVWRREGF